MSEPEQQGVNDGFLVTFGGVMHLIQLASAGKVLEKVNTMIYAMEMNHRTGKVIYPIKVKAFITSPIIPGINFTNEYHRVLKVLTEEFQRRTGRKTFFVYHLKYLGGTFDNVDKKGSFYRS